MFGTNQARFFSQLAAMLARNKNDKFYKILKQARPVFDTLNFQEGDVIPPQVLIPQTPAKYPVYHYELLFFKRQNRGLYGGQQRKRSKTSSEAGNKNLRVHLPNIQKGSLWLATLEKKISTRVLTRVLKTIDKEGGLDNYLTKDKPARVKTLGAAGWKLRYDVLRAQELKEARQEVPETKEVIADGTRLTQNKKYLLNMLYNHTQRNSYVPLPRSVFNKTHKLLTTGEVVQKLRELEVDLSEVTA